MMGVLKKDAPNSAALPGEWGKPVDWDLIGGYNLKPHQPVTPIPNVPTTPEKPNTPTTPNTPDTPHNPSGISYPKTVFNLRPPQILGLKYGVKNNGSIKKSPQ